MVQGVDTVVEVEAALRFAVERGDAGAFFSTLRSAAATVRSSHSLATSAYKLAEALPRDVEGFRSIDLRILRNVTIEPWLPHVFLALVERGFAPRITLGDYDVFEAYLDGSAPDEASAGVTLLLWDGEELVGDALYSTTEADYEFLSERLCGLAKRFAARGPTLVSTLAPALVDASRVYSSHQEWSWEVIRLRLNEDLRACARPDSAITLYDLARETSRFGSARYRDTRSFYAYRIPFGLDFMPVAAAGLAGTVVGAIGVPKKCVVVDCDNTLWSGVLGEDGPGGVGLGGEYPGVMFRHFQRFLSSLHARGVLLAINSKNNQDEVIDFFRDSPDVVLSLEDFAAMRINWDDKAQNLAALASELNIGLDSMVFIDDSAVECERITQAYPEVQVERFPDDPLAIPEFIANLQGFETLRVTEDDLKRSDSIRANAERETLRESAPDARSFIESLEIELTIARCEDDRVDRVSQLTQRTNQFNLTTKRYSMAEIRQFSESALVYTMQMRDRFSDYGTIAVCIVVEQRPERALIDSFLMSCRAFGRHIEDSFLSVTLDDLRKRGYSSVEGRFIPTGRNAMVESFYLGAGFSSAGGSTEDEEGGATFALDLEVDRTGPERYAHSVNIEGL